ncbi:MAG TPA: aldo/keto reductase [Streptosporangiaceae bacterium]|jgi:aryl-alcohol dehydrogenase-like predicted oxidoreductase
MTTETVRLGTGGPLVSRQGLGCMGMGGSYGPADDRESAAVIRRAIELGVTLFDTADLYGSSTRPGSNEEMVGAAVRPYRDAIVLASKFGFVFDPVTGARGLCGTPAYAGRACDASLRRLGTDRIDLYYLHRVDPEVPIEETVGAMADLVRAGKVRHLGLSMVTAAELRAAHAVHPIAAVQSEYSLWCRGIEADVLPAARALGVGVVPYAPLGRGFLAGSVRPGSDVGRFRATIPAFQPAALEANAHIADAVREIAERHDATAAQVALAWVYAQGRDLVPIPGTRRRRYLEDNVAALAVRLTADELARLSGLRVRLSPEGGPASRAS